jgi:hypothetical protein
MFPKEKFEATAEDSYLVALSLNPSTQYSIIGFYRHPQGCKPGELYSL